MVGYFLDLWRRWSFNKSRMIFRYWDGRRTRLGDPIVLWRKLMAHEDFRSDDFALVRVKSLFPAIMEKMARVYREVFEVQAADAGGLTEAECVANLRAFVEYAGVQKKSTDSTQTLPPVTDQQSSQDSVPETNTPDDSPCSLTQTESTTGTLLESPAA